MVSMFYELGYSTRSGPKSTTAFSCVKPVFWTLINLWKRSGAQTHCLEETTAKNAINQPVCLPQNQKPSACLELRLCPVPVH